MSILKSTSRRLFALSRCWSSRCQPLVAPAVRCHSDEASDALRMDVGLEQNIFGNLRRAKGRDRTKEKDRRIPVSLAASLKYMDSDAYQKTYRGFLVWQPYRRGFGAQLHMPPDDVRVSCVGDDGFVRVGWPCPICRDEYLVIDYRNVKLISQFVNPHTAQVYPPRKTNVCQVKNEELLVAIEKAKFYGTLTFQVPFRTYDYRDYVTAERLQAIPLEQGFDLREDPVLQKALQIPDVGDHHPYAIENWP